MLTLMLSTVSVGADYPKTIRTSISVVESVLIISSYLINEYYKQGVVYCIGLLWKGWRYKLNLKLLKNYL